MEKPAARWRGSTIRENVGAATNPDGAPAVPDAKPRNNARSADSVARWPGRQRGDFVWSV